MTKKTTNSTSEPAVDTKAAQDLEAMLAAGVNGDFANVVVTMHEVDLLAEYERLKAEMEPDPARRNVQVIYAYVDAVESNARKAQELVGAAKVELIAFKATCERIMAGMRDVCTKELEEEKRTGVRTKQVTDGDVVARMRDKYGDEFADQERQLLKAENVVANLVSFAALWSGRCTRAGAMLGARSNPKSAS